MSTYLPVPKVIRDLLTDLLDREVALSPSTPLAPTAKNPCTVGVYVDDLLQRWIIDLVRVTRELDIVAIGASVRGSLALERAARSWALLSGRDYVLPEDIELLFLPVLGHRILFTPSFLVELRKIGRTQALEDFRSRCLHMVPRPEATLGGDGEVVRLSHGERAD